MGLNIGCYRGSFKNYKSLGLNSKPVKPKALEMGSRMGIFKIPQVFLTCSQVECYSSWDIEWGMRVGSQAE